MSDKEKVIRYLDSVYPKTLFTYQLTGIDTPFGFIGSQGDRRARDLAPGKGKDFLGRDVNFTYRGSYKMVDYEIEGLLKDGKRCYRLRILNIIKADNKIQIGQARLPMSLPRIV